MKVTQQKLEKILKDGGAKRLDFRKRNASGFWVSKHQNELVIWVDVPACFRDIFVEEYVSILSNAGIEHRVNQPQTYSGMALVYCKTEV